MFYYEQLHGGITESECNVDLIKWDVNNAFPSKAANTWNKIWFKDHKESIYDEPLDRFGNKVRLIKAEAQDNINKACDKALLGIGPEFSFSSSSFLNKQVRIALMMPITPKQYKKAIRGVRLWAKDHFFPCRTISTAGHDVPVYTATLAIVQSGGTKSAAKEFLTILEKMEDLNACFSKITHAIVTLPKGREDYEYGPGTLFMEMMSGNMFQQHYSHVMQIEPDVLPVQPYWLDRIAMETQDSTDFWMKGSLGMYFDKDDSIGGCVLGDPRFCRMEALGPRLLHINGNALYNLRDVSFRKVIEDMAVYSRNTETDISEEALLRDEFPVTRGARMVCQVQRLEKEKTKRWLCKGSFDSTLFEYIFGSLDRMQRCLPRLRVSEFMMNHLNLRQLSMDDIPATTVLVHKLESVLKDTCKDPALKGKLGERMQRLCQNTLPVLEA